MDDNVVNLIGKSVTDALQSSLIKRLGELPAHELIDGREYFEFRASGISLDVRNGIVSVLHLYAEGYDSYSSFKGTLPSGISFQFSREKIRALLGVPEKSGDSHVDVIAGLVPTWDRYDILSHCVHIEYGSVDQRIVLVTVMSPHAVPR